MRPEAARSSLLAHGIPAEALDVTRSQALRCFYSEPCFSMGEELEAFIPALAGLIPIFEQNGEAVVGYLPDSNRFILFYYEDGGQTPAPVEVMAFGYQQFAGRLLLDLEAAGLSNYYAELASLLKFKYADELRSLLDAEPYDDEAVETFYSKLATQSIE